MADRKLLAGHAVRRLRRREGLTQAAMAEMLAISPSYLNLVEKNQRPLSAALLVKLAEAFDFDPRALAAGEPGGGAAAIRRRLADPMFADLEIDRVLDHHSKHREIVDAVVERDAERLRALVTDMFEMGVQFHQTITRALTSYEKVARPEPADGTGAPRKRGRPRKNPIKK